MVNDLSTQIPIAANSQWWHGFLRGVTAIRPPQYAWAREQAELRTFEQTRPPFRLEYTGP